MVRVGIALVRVAVCCAVDDDVGGVGVEDLLDAVVGSWRGWWWL